jgi:hypothetical protein
MNGYFSPPDFFRQNYRKNWIYKEIKKNEEENYGD